MGLFRRIRDRGVTPEVLDGDEGEEAFAHQSAVLELLDAFHAHDTAALAASSSAERAEQEQARRVLYEYVDEMWDDLKRRGLEPADHPEQHNPVAALRDLTGELRSHVEQARDAARRARTRSNAIRSGLTTGFDDR